MQLKFAKKCFIGLVSAAMLCAAMTGCDDKPAAPNVQAPATAPKVEGAAVAAKKDAAATVPSGVPETKKTDHPDHPR